MKIVKDFKRFLELRKNASESDRALVDFMTLIAVAMTIGLLASGYFALDILFEMAGY